MGFGDLLKPRGDRPGLHSLQAFSARVSCSLLYSLKDARNALRVLKIQTDTLPRIREDSINECYGDISTVKSTLSLKLRPVPDSTVSLSFRYQKNDIVRAVRSHNASRHHPRLDLVIAVGLAWLGADLWRSSSSNLFGALCVVTSACIVIFLLAAFVVNPPLAWRYEPKFRDEYSLKFSPEGIHYQTAHIDSHIEWSFYTRVLVDAHSYLLYFGSRKFTIIPKRVLGSIEERGAFEELLAQFVPEIVRNT